MNNNIYTNDNKSQSTILDNNKVETSSSGIVGSIQDSTLNLFNLTVKEIIEKQSAILDKNIAKFKESAQKVFEQDMKLMAAKTNYVNVQNKIKVNMHKMNELLDGLDYFQKELEKKLDEQGNKQTGAFEKVDVNTSNETIEEFEMLCDKFYEKVEGFEDENGGVLDLINENYELVEKIDGLLDNLELKTNK